jgi:glyoxylase-like metal-dependent hydrolase (beta-lactamase superfamily II)
MGISAPVKSKHYAPRAVCDGVVAAIARKDGYAICNSGLVDLGPDVVVFDTSMTRQAARDLWAMTEGFWNRAPALAVNSHRHLDHLLGNPEFARVPIWGTRRTREVVLEQHDQQMAEMQRGALERDIRGLEARRDSVRSGTARRDIEFILQINRAILSEVDRVALVPPDRTFDTRVELPGYRKAELRSFGAGHTEADAVLFLPEDKVVFAGDLVVSGVQPSLGSGDPMHWLEVLDSIDRLQPEQIVPGHGPVLSSGGTEETRGYVSGVLEAASADEGAPLPRAIRKWEGSLSLEENVRFARSWLSTREAAR